MLGDISASDWRALSPLLDQALTLEEPELPTWLEQVARQHPKLAETLRVLLEQRAAITAQAFLEHSPHLLDDGFPDRTIGAYTLVRPLGEGGMGRVWLARRSDGRYQGLAALKLLTAMSIHSESRERFEREGSVLAQLEHPNIARLLDAGIADDGRPYLVIEYVEGQPIDRFCNAADFGIEDRIRLIIDVADAVAEAHRKLIVHRDIKPSNVLVRHDGVVKLLDFGIAKLLAPGEGALTADYGGLLTPPYAAPEQFAGGPITTATDVYGLGVLSFELLTGRRPFEHDAVNREAQVISRADVPQASRAVVETRRNWRKALEGDLDNIIGKSLCVDPRERYGTVSALADDLRRYLAHEPVSARRNSLLYIARKFGWRHRAGVAAAGLSLLALVAAAGVSMSQRQEAVRQRDEAQFQLRRAQASNEFVTSLLSQAGPGGRGLTPVELLDRGIEAVKARYADDPGFSVHMLIVLSGRYMDLGHVEGEYRALLEAESIARASGDRHQLLDVHCNTVETEVFSNRLVAAASRLREIRTLLAELDGVEPATRANCLRQEAMMAREQGRPADGVIHLEAARTVLEREGMVDGNLYSSLFSWLASFNRAAGRSLEAHRYNELELAYHERRGRQQTVAGTLAKFGVASSHLTLGEPDRAAPMLDALVKAGAADLHPLVLVRYADALGELGRPGQALETSRAALEAIRATGRDAYLADGEIAFARWLSRTERPAAAGPLLDAVIERSATAQDVERLSASLLGRVELRLRTGELTGAQEDVEQALELLGYPDLPRGEDLGRALMLHSMVLAGLGEVGAALVVARRAEKVVLENVRDSNRSTTAAAARQTLAKAQLLAGDRVGAEQSLDLAAAAYGNVLGAAHPATRDAAGMLASLRRDDR